MSSRFKQIVSLGVRTAVAVAGIISATFLTAGRSAHAQPSSAGPAFKPGEHWSLILQKLRDRGVHQVGDFNLEEFTRAVEDPQHGVRWGSAPSDGTRPLFAAGRRSAYFTVNDKKVYLGDDLRSYPEDAVSQLELHEALGATGYNDRQYQISSSLHMLSALPAGTVEEQARTVLARELFQNSMLKGMPTNPQGDATGGATSIGGGGDVIALMAKSLVLNHILTQYGELNSELSRKISRKLLEAYPRIGFEPQYDPHQQFVAVQYLAKTKNSRSRPWAGVPFDSGTGAQEMITIYVPALKWQSANEAGAHEAVINEAARLIESLFPSSETAIPGSVGRCSLHIQFKFPPTSDTHLKDIQRARAQILSGCFDQSLTPVPEGRVQTQQDGVWVGMIEVRAPQFTDFLGRDNAMEPVDMGQLSFLCQLQVSGQKGIYPVHLSFLPGAPQAMTVFDFVDADGAEFGATLALLRSSQQSLARWNLLFFKAEATGGRALVAKRSGLFPAMDAVDRFHGSALAPSGAALALICMQE